MTIACFDIGGTDVKFAAIRNKEILQRESCPTPKSLADLVNWIEKQVRPTSDVLAISISLPGSVDPKTGIVAGISAVPYIHGPSWFDILAFLNLPIFMENDANCVGLSQLAAQGELENFACVVIGTGIGGAVVLDRKLIRGWKGYAGEFGYMLSDPLTNWSQKASTGNMVAGVRRAKAELDWDGVAIYKAAAEGDPVCQTALQSMYDELALGLITIFYCLGTKDIFLGGAISQNREFLAGVQASLQSIQARNSDIPELPTVQACHFHGDANLMGAYMLATDGLAH
ncbi:ROK family protein [Streptococcus gallinaceus]|uniref:NBD/HSP70 family sugar kinase n=1 Tax=Streptococcus gallinaceus TaxID=165758 RepID=A0ABV2JKA4_9STRE